MWDVFHGPSTGPGAGIAERPNAKRGHAIERS
jgi:hypothetical protein